MNGKRVQVEYECELKEVYDLTGNDEEGAKKEAMSKLSEHDQNKEWRVLAVLSNGKCFGCDLIVSATGVIPNGDAIKCENLDLDKNGAIKVNERLETSVQDVYAAGDVCGVDFGNELWFQMRLWTQARLLGMYAAQSMTNMATEPDFTFEVFAHATKFFGYKVILLGLFNGQTVDVSDYEALVRVTKGKEYVKCVMQNGKMKGAVLVGETDLEETFENLILNQMDLSALADDLLNPDIDIEDYFD